MRLFVNFTLSFQQFSRSDQFLTNDHFRQFFWILTIDIDFKSDAHFLVNEFSNSKFHEVEILIEVENYMNSKNVIFYQYQIKYDV